MGRKAAAVMLACLTVGAATEAGAEEVTTLPVADSFPASHYLVKNGIQAWMMEVTERTKGAVRFQYFPAQQLEKAADLLSLAQTGVVQVSSVAPSYVSDKMPLSGVAELPGLFTSSCAGSPA